MAAVLEPEEPITAVHIDGLAVLKIVKHCQESLPSLVTGSLLGLVVQNGVLEITHAFPFPQPASATDNLAPPSDTAELDGTEFQLEMMKMLREVNMDNNCVGWYQSIVLGSYPLGLLENQSEYQTELSPHAVVLLYDPIQTTRGNLTLKCVRLTPEALVWLSKSENSFLDPSGMLEEVPVTIQQSSLVSALLHNVSTGHYAAVAEDAVHGEVAPVFDADTTFDTMDLSTNPYLEKHLEYLTTWVDDLAAEQTKFNYYTKGLARGENRRNKQQNNETAVDAKEAWKSAEAPRRLDSLLISNQIRSYCDQVDQFADGGFGKLFLAEGLHKE